MTKSVLRIELAEDKDILHFLHEYTVPCNPWRLDFVIKKDGEAPVKNADIGSIFRKYNLITYKGPGDSMNVAAFQQALAYTYGFPSTQKDAVLRDNVTLTLLTHDEPQALMQYLKSSYVHPTYKNVKNPVVKINPGIYTIYTEMFPAQLIITTKIQPEKHPFLRSVTNRLSEEIPFSELIKEYTRNREDLDYKNFMNNFIRANQKSEGEIRYMCEALYELFAEDLIKAEKRGEERGEKRGEKRGKKRGKMRGKLLGEKIGAERISKLTFYLLTQGRLEDLKRSTTDRKFQQSLLEEFRI